MTVVKDVPLALNFYDASVIIAAVVHGTFCRLIGTDIGIVVAHDYAAVCEIAVGESADSIAEFVTQDRGIDQVIKTVPLSDGGSLEELMAFKAGSLAVEGVGDQEVRPLFDGDHVRL